MDIKIAVVGKIIAGTERGMYVKVLDDAAQSGGFLVLTSLRPDMQDGFDSWVADRIGLNKYFSESEWVVEWLD